MSRVTTVEKEVEACWDCPHFLYRREESLDYMPNYFNIISTCAKTGYRVTDIDEIPDFCPLEEFDEDEYSY